MIYFLKDLEIHFEAIIALFKKYKESEDHYNEEELLTSYEVSGWSEIRLEQIFDHELVNSLYWPNMKAVAIRKKDLFGAILIEYLESSETVGFDGQTRIHLI
jgi:hypothetical protein